MVGGSSENKINLNDDIVINIFIFIKDTNIYVKNIIIILFFIIIIIKCKFIYIMNSITLIIK